MPYFNIDTNQKLDPESIRITMQKASALIADLLSKPESFVMVSVRPDGALIFGGTPEPAAFVSLKSIGLPKERCSELSEKICDFILNELGVPPERVFIEFKDLERSLFGWNAKTF